MRGCLFTLLLGAVAIGLFVVVVFPALVAGALTAGVEAAGLQSESTVVTVTSDPPTDLLGMHADQVRIRASDATFRGMEIANLDVTLHDLRFVDRTARSIDGFLDGMVVPDVGGRELALDSVRLSGGGETVIATTRIAGAQVEGLIADGIEAKLGKRPTSVALTVPDRLTVRLDGTVRGRLIVSPSGDLQLRITNGPAEGLVVTLLRGGVDVPLRLTEAAVSPAGDLELTGELAVSLLG
ncbi:MAG TPA: hypothetical protein VIZ22_12075 [Candidatus Limnocylindrales bacterium]